MNLVGDPAAINAMASLLDAKADQLSAIGRRVKARADNSRWQCAKADRFRHTMADRSRNADQLAGELHGIARDLHLIAGQVQGEIDSLDRLERNVRNILGSLARNPALKAVWEVSPWHSRPLPAPGDPAWASVARVLGVR